MTRLWKGKRFVSLLLAFALWLTMLPPVTLPVFSVGSDAEYKANIGGTAKLNTGANIYITDDPAAGLKYTSDYILMLDEVAQCASLKLIIEDCYVGNGGYWYKIKAAEGHTLPSKLAAKPWIYQNDIPNWGAQDALTVTPPPKVYNPGVYGALIGSDAKLISDNFVALRIAEEPTVALSEAKQLNATDIPDWNLQLVVEAVHWVEETNALWLKVAAAEGHTLPSILAQYPWVYQNDTSVYAQENWAQTSPDALRLTLPDNGKIDLTTGVAVSGDLPAGATLNVTIPQIDGEALPNVYDIKIYDANGDEWQPIAYGKTVQISIPILDAQEGSANVLHFIDYAADINGDETFVPMGDAEEEALIFFAPALNAYEEVYGNRNAIAVEKYRDVTFTDGKVTIETDSFSVYSPNYVEQKKVNGKFTVEFRSYDEDADPASEKTYYVTAGETVKFNFEYSGTRGIGFIDFDQNGTYSIKRITDNKPLREDLQTIRNATVIKNNFLWQDMLYTEEISYTFTKDFLGLEEEPKVGEMFEIRWVSGTEDSWMSAVLQGKNDRWTRVMIVDEFPTTFDANGGQFESNKESQLTKTIVSYQPVNAFEIPVRDGYIFKGWAYAKDSQENAIYKTTDNFPGTMEKNSTLYAQWEPLAYTITYVLPETVVNSASFVSQTKYHDQPLLLHNFLPIDIDDHTKFQGWDTDGDGVVNLKPEEIIAGHWYTGNADLTLVGIWNDAVLAVIYNANGGFGEPETHYAYKSNGYIATVSEVIPKRNGYKFVGWKDANGKSYKGGDKVNLGTNNLVLEAQWERVLYAIEFVPGFTTSTSMDKMAALIYDYDDATKFYTRHYANLLSNIFEQTGYKFMGWALTAEDAKKGIVQYENAENVPVSDIVDEVIARGISTDSIEIGVYTSGNAEEPALLDHTLIKLYAVWAEATYTIFYTADPDDTGVSISALTQTVGVNSGATITSSALRSRYTFAGWKDSNGEIYAYGDPVPQGNDGDTIILTAIWQFNVVGYMYSMIDGSPVQNGAILIGGENMGSWYTLPITGSGAVPSMTFKPDEGYEIVKVYIEDVEYTKENPGADLVFSADGSCTYAGMDNCSEPLYIAVQTQAKTYTVTWLNWDGTTLHTVTGVVHGTTPIYPGDANPTRPAVAGITYAFVGWEPSIGPVTGDITYKATYAEVRDNYTVTWKVDDEVFKTETVEFGRTAIAPEDCKMDGFTFVGWNTQKDGKGTFYAPGANISVTANMELYAQWEASLTSLTIQVSGANLTLDPDQSFLFTLSGNGVDLTVVVRGNGSVVIDGLTIGNEYTVTMQTDWSWRYEIVKVDGKNKITYEKVLEPTITGDSIKFKLDQEGTLTFCVVRENDRWLDGNGYAKGN